MYKILFNMLESKYSCKALFLFYAFIRGKKLNITKGKRSKNFAS